jgi:hypothetical protein
MSARSESITEAPPGRPAKGCVVPAAAGRNGASAAGPAERIRGPRRSGHRDLLDGRDGERANCVDDLEGDRGEGDEIACDATTRGSGRGRRIWRRDAAPGAARASRGGSVGIENVEDLRADLDGALRAAFA